MQNINLRQFESFQLLGASAIVFQKAFGANDFLIEEFLTKNNIDAYEPDQWYSLVKNLEIMYAVLNELGENMILEVGKSTANYLQLPPDVDGIEKMLASLTYAYHSFHGQNNQSLFNPITGEMKNGIGNYKYLVLDHNAAKLICDNPYPCAFDKGLALGLARKFKPLATVEYEQGIKHRKDGAAQSSYIIRW